VEGEETSTVTRPSAWLGARPGGAPYRVAGRDSTIESAPTGYDGPLRVALLIFWVVSAVRVVGAIAGHETFGAEGTLAAMAVLGIPWAAWRARRERARARI
jgi:hypothetical protein